MSFLNSFRKTGLWRVVMDWLHRIPECGICERLFAKGLLKEQNVSLFLKNWWIENHKHVIIKTSQIV